MARISDLTGLLCAISMMSAVAEVLLAGRRGSEIVCLLLSLAGVGGILSACAEFRL